MALDYQEKHDRTLENITNEPIKLRKNNSKLGSDFSIARSANNLLRNEITKLETSGISTITKDNDIENKLLDVLTKIAITIDLLNVEARH